jgi:hypothetical protein
VFDGHDGDLPEVVIDAVYHSVVARRALRRPSRPSFSGLPARCGFSASEPYRDSTAAVAAFSGSLVSARRDAVA